jgi:hypothetical protein
VPAYLNLKFGGQGFSDKTDNSADPLISIRNISLLNREDFPFKLPSATGISLMTREDLSSYTSGR